MQRCVLRLDTVTKQQHRCKAATVGRAAIRSALLFVAVLCVRVGQNFAEVKIQVQAGAGSQNHEGQKHAGVGAEWPRHHQN